MHQSKFRRLNLQRYHLSKWKAPGFGSCCTRCPNDVSFHAGTPAARQLGEKKENGGLFAESSHVKLLPGITPQPPLCYDHPGQVSTWRNVDTHCMHDFCTLQHAKLTLATHISSTTSMFNFISMLSSSQMSRPIAFLNFTPTHFTLYFPPVIFLIVCLLFFLMFLPTVRKLWVQF